VSNVSSTLATWSSLILLLSIHLFANYKAVRAVRMLTLNRQRANIVFSTLIEQGKVLSPEQVSKQERVFERDGVLRWGASEVTGRAQIGVRLHLLLASVAGSVAATGSIRNPVVDLAELTEVYVIEEFLLWVDAKERRVLIVLKEGCTATSQLKAWTVALMVTRRLKHEKLPTSDPQGVLLLLRETLDEANRSFDESLQQLAAAGWDVGSSALETRPGFRISIPTGRDKKYKAKGAGSRERV
jgi:Vitamin B6 photo-protection and homoeostasis